MTVMRWGVLGASSRIYRKALLPVFEELPDHEVVAEARRAGDDESPYAELVRRDDVDAVYIPLPNHLHLPWIERAVEAGKHVLCEKPIALDAADVERAFEVAAAHDRHLIEAYMWPHHARSQRMLELIHDGAIGQPRFLNGTFTYQLGDPGDHRADGRGGGVVLDVGIYCIGPALLLAGREPVGWSAAAVRDHAGIDRAMTGWVDWGKGFIGNFEVCFEAPGRTTLEVVGTDGIMTFPDYFPSGRDAVLPIVIDRHDGTQQVEQVADGNGYRGMVQQFAAVVRGEAEPLFNAEHSLRLAKILDGLHAASR